MIENLVVMLIVGASALYAGRKYLWPVKAKASGCGSGCSSCDNCASAPAPAAPSKQRVIQIHRR